MQFDILTLFPRKIEAIVAESILGKAIASNKISVKVYDLRNWTVDKRHTVDDRVFGGGAGMLLMVEPIYKALKEIGVYPNRPADTKVLLTSARGKTWDQPQAQAFASEVNRVVIICGNYEGVDHRVVEHLIDAEVSIGNYVLTGGELAAGVIIDSTARLIPGVLGNEDSLRDESHTLQPGNDVEYPQYTRPATFSTEEGESWPIPDILLSGNHQEIDKWRQTQRQLS